MIISRFISFITNEERGSKFNFRKRFYSRYFSWNEYVVPSTLQFASLIDLLLEPVQDHQTFDQLRLGLQEALVNAVRHGNLGDPNKIVRVRRIVTPRWLVWQIQDQGDGVREECRKGFLPSELDSQTGRGLFLIYQCFDDVRWSSRGNRLQLASRRFNKVNALGIQDP